MLAGGLPGKATMAKVKDGGAKLLAFAPSLGDARKLARAGADALVIEGMEAGGHIGPVATSVLAQEILPYMNEHMSELPIFVAGGIGHGEAVAAYLNMGAAGSRWARACLRDRIRGPSELQASLHPRPCA